MARYGDGELALMRGKSIPFQEANPFLSKRLKQVLKEKDKDFLIGLPRFLYYDDKNLNHETRFFWKKHKKKLMKQLYPFLQKDRQYISSEISLLYTCYNNKNFDSYFQNVRSIWQDKEVVLIAGSGVLDFSENNIFDNVAHMDYIEAPSINAFSAYDLLLEKALSFDKKKLFVLILGPTATILAYDLAKNGYQAIDFGHIGKSYATYKKNISLDGKLADFFAPD